MKVDTYYIKLVHWVIKMNSDNFLDIKFPGKDIHSSTEFLKLAFCLFMSARRRAVPTSTDSTLCSQITYW